MILNYLYSPIKPRAPLLINFYLKTSASSSGVLAPLPADDAVAGRW